jgi:hypothetical protein
MLSFYEPNLVKISDIHLTEQIEAAEIMYFLSATYTQLRLISFEITESKVFCHSTDGYNGVINNKT